MKLRPSVEIGISAELAPEIPAALLPLVSGAGLRVGFVLPAGLVMLR